MPLKEPELFLDIPIFDNGVVLPRRGNNGPNWGWCLDH